MGGSFVNRSLNDDDANDEQRSGAGQSPATFGVFVGFGVLFLVCAAWATIHGLSDDGNARSWIGCALSLVAAALCLGAAARKRR